MISTERLKQLRQERHETQQEVAAKVKISQSAYGYYETGKKSPGLETVLRLARHFGVSTDYLLGRTDIRDGKKGEYNFRVEVLGKIPAGKPSEAIQYIIGWESLDPNRYSLDHEYFGLKVYGNSMYPVYSDGDIVIVQKAESADSGKDVVAIIDGDDATLKRLVKYEDGKIELRPLNPTFPSSIYTPQEVETLPVQILGFVRELRRNM